MKHYIIVNGNVTCGATIQHNGNRYRVMSQHTGETFSVRRVFGLFYVNRHGTRDIHVVRRLWQYPLSCVALRLAMVWFGMAKWLHTITSSRLTRT